MESMQNAALTIKSTAIPMTKKPGGLPWVTGSHTKIVVNNIKVKARTAYINNLDFLIYGKDAVS